jgi:hypothetical protein
LHFHLIPDHAVYVMDDQHSENRNFLDDANYKQLVDKTRKKFK